MSESRKHRVAQNCMQHVINHYKYFNRHSVKCRLKLHFFSLCFNDWQRNALQVRFRAWRALNSLLLTYLLLNRYTLNLMVWPEVKYQPYLLPYLLNSGSSEAVGRRGKFKDKTDTIRPASERFTQLSVTAVSHQLYNSREDDRQHRLKLSVCQLIN